MKSFVKLYSNENGQIKKFLNDFLYNNREILNQINNLTQEFQVNYSNPVEMSDIIGSFIDNNDSYKINMWICIDQGLLINITQNNANDIIKYLYERFPY